MLIDPLPDILLGLSRMYIECVDLSLNERTQVLYENSLANSCLSHDDDRYASHHTEEDNSEFDDVVLRERDIFKALT